ncbi:hypothetical protein GS444_12110 [Rhodococcus hoagii]|nr:hypothetical protein [Prescottella equi]
MQHSFATSGNHSIGAVFTAGAGFLGSTATAKSIMVIDPVVVDVTTPPRSPSRRPRRPAADHVDGESGSVQRRRLGAVQGRRHQHRWTVAVVNGTATAQTSFTTAGSHSITAVFTGSTGFKSSTSSAQTVTVNAPVVQTSLTLSAPSDAQTGSAITFTAAVTPANAAGTVQFTVDGNKHWGRRHRLERCCHAAVHVLRCGVHSVGASFAGAAGFTNSSATSRPVQVSVPTRRTSSRRRPSPCRRRPPWDSGDAVAEVSGGTNLPGTVQFFDGDVPMQRQRRPRRRCRDGSAHLR